MWAWYLGEVQAKRAIAAELGWSEVWETPRSTAGRWRRVCLDAQVELVELPRLELVPAVASA